MSDSGVMYIHRSAPSANYTVVRNQIFEAGLGVDALGLLTYLISRPATWRVSPEQLRRQFKIGRERLARIIGQLEEAGYVRREQRRDPVTKSFGAMEFYVYDDPAGHDGGGEAVPQSENPQAAEPCAVEPVTSEPETANGAGKNNIYKKNNNKNTTAQQSDVGKRAVSSDRGKGRGKPKRKAVAKAGGALVPADRRKVFVERWSEPWKAWEKARGRPSHTTDRRCPDTGVFQTGWWFDSEWPPGHERAEASQGCQTGQGG